MKPVKHNALQVFDVVECEISGQKCISFLRSETHFCGIWSNPISKTLPGMAFLSFLKKGCEGLK